MSYTKAHSPEKHTLRNGILKKYDNLKHKRGKTSIIISMSLVKTRKRVEDVNTVVLIYQPFQRA